MKLREEDLKKAYQASLQEEGPGNLCPSVETLLNAFSAELSEEEKLKIADHVSECGFCFRKFRAVQEIIQGSKALAAEWKGVALTETETALLKRRARERIRELEKEHREEEKKPKAKTGALVSRYWPVPLAAGIGIILLVAFLIIEFPSSRKEDVIRGPEGTALQLIAPKGQVDLLPIVFKWDALPGAKEYEAVLMDEELNVLWLSGRTKETRGELPFELGKTIQPGKPYYWKVLVYKEAGEVEESDLQKFKLDTSK